MFSQQFLMRAGLQLFSVIFGSFGIFFFFESFASATAAAYAVLFLSVATAIVVLTPKPSAEGPRARRG
jgi:hypothetical protein